jgi:hypothetical protein
LVLLDAQRHRISGVAMVCSCKRYCNGTDCSNLVASGQRCRVVSLGTAPAVRDIPKPGIRANAPKAARHSMLLLARMKTTFGAIALCWTAAAAASENYKAVTLSADEARLTITTSAGAQFEAPTVPDQVGFQSPRISRDGRNVGWLALFPNCCTSYHIPLILVVLDSGQHLHTFDGIKLATFRWCFLPDSASVAYMQTQVHGTNYEHFEHRAISDGRLIAEYEYPNEEPENAEARKLAPPWVKCVPE